MNSKFIVPFPILTQTESTSDLFSFFKPFRLFLDSFYFVYPLSDGSTPNIFSPNDEFYNFEKKYYEYLKTESLYCDSILLCEINVCKCNRIHIKDFFKNKVFVLLSQYKFKAVLCNSIDLAYLISNKFPDIEIYMRYDGFLKCKDYYLLCRSFNFSGVLFPKSYICSKFTDAIVPFDLKKIYVFNELCDPKCNLYFERCKFNLKPEDSCNTCSNLILNPILPEAENLTYFLSGNFCSFDWLKTTFLSILFSNDRFG